MPLRLGLCAPRTYGQAPASAAGAFEGFAKRFSALGICQMMNVLASRFALNMIAAATVGGFATSVVTQIKTQTKTTTA
jgi:hypothetical protein